MQAAGASINIKGDLFLQLISVRTDMLIRDVAILDAYFFFFVISGIALLYLTMPQALVVRRCTPHLSFHSFTVAALPPLMTA